MMRDDDLNSYTIIIKLHINNTEKQDSDESIPSVMPIVMYILHTM